MHKRVQAGLYLLVLCLFSSRAAAQTDSFRHRFIQSLSRDINRNYLSSRLAGQMTDYINSKYKTGGYDSTLNADEFAFEITKDLRKISKDNHITVVPLHYDYLEDSIQAAKRFDALTPRQRRKRFPKGQDPVKRFDEEYKERTKDDMFTYGDIKILPGNVGYVEILNFESTSYYKKRNKKRIAIASVFEYLQNTKTIIIDLRDNTGGLVPMAVKFCSYFSPQPNFYFITTESIFRYDSSGVKKELSIIKKHHTDSKVISYTNNNNKTVFILVSKRTFSAGETVAYKIKRFIPQALIIGEPTRGGGNTFSESISSKYYDAIIPSGKCFDEANNNFNIEGIGIFPDLATNADSAFDKAYSLAYKYKGNGAEQKTKYLHSNKTLKSNTKFDQNILEYLGNYRKARIYENNGKLYMIYDTFHRCLLLPVQKDLFVSNVFDSIQFIRDNNKVVEIAIKYKDGYIEKFRKI